MAQMALNGTRSFSSDVEVPRKFLTIRSKLVGRVTYDQLIALFRGKRGSVVCCRRVHAVRIRCVVGAVKGTPRVNGVLRAQQVGPAGAEIHEAARMCRSVDVWAAEMCWHR